jgi:hypothetical protein
MAYEAIAAPAMTSPPKKTDQEDRPMKDVVYTFAMFHTLAAVAIFSFMLYSVIRLVNRQKP